MRKGSKKMVVLCVGFDSRTFGVNEIAAFSDKLMILFLHHRRVVILPGTS